MLSMIEHHCVEQKQWITHDEMMNITVIAESTPGPIAINCAAFAGIPAGRLFRRSCRLTLGIVFPSFAVIYVISRFLDHFLEITLIAHAFRALKLGPELLILDAAVFMIQKMPKKLLCPNHHDLLSGSYADDFCFFLEFFLHQPDAQAAPAHKYFLSVLLKEMSQKKGGASSLIYWSLFLGFLQIGCFFLRRRLRRHSPDP